MAAGAVALLLLSGSVTLGLYPGSGPSSSSSGSGSGPDSERGKMELRRVQSLASQPRFGECWARALEDLDMRCKELTSESQSRIALRFTHCHLSRLTETSAGVAEQLQSTRQITEDLIEAQSAALQAQQEILNNGEELRVTLQDSTQGLRALFSELSSVSREQQVALSELFNRVSFLQSFLMMEAHSLSSCCYNAAALCTSFLLTSTQRSSRARLALLGLVCLNFYLERKIYQFVMSSDQPEHRHMELLSVYVGLLRRVMVCVGVCVLLCVCVRYRDPVQQSLQVLQQLRETQRGLQEALQHAESLGQRQTEENQRQVKVTGHTGEEMTSPASVLQRRAQRKRREEGLRRRHDEEEESSSDLSHLSHTGSDTTLPPYTTHNASVSPSRRPRRSSSPLVYSVLVEDRQRRYSLRSRKSETH
ncbi:uncharacterized protein [Trachinotus anak]|uniref:uncharacterized protein isoform X3 n=1 Tax=Trachinotus anak TaxID=443729 RepID=UPI0039F1D1AC